MLCDGKCRSKNKKCGLLKELIVSVNGKPQTIEKCVFEAILDSMLRQEQASVRIQAAIEHSRNEHSNEDLETRKAVAHGFIGLIHTFQNNPEGVKRSGVSQQKLIKLVELTEKKQEEISEDQKRIISE